MNSEQLDLNILHVGPEPPWTTLEVNSWDMASMVCLHDALSPIFKNMKIAYLYSYKFTYLSKYYITEHKHLQFHSHDRLICVYHVRSLCIIYTYISWFTIRLTVSTHHDLTFPSFHSTFWEASNLCRSCLDKTQTEELLFNQGSTFRCKYMI